MIKLVEFESNCEIIPDVEKNFNLFAAKDMRPIPTLLILYKMGNDLVNDYLTHPKVQKLLKSDAQFDVCVFEVFNADALVV